MGDETTGHGGTVTEPDPLPRSGVATVARDRRPHTRPARLLQDVGGDDPHLLECARTGALDHDIGGLDEAAQGAPARRSRYVQRDGTLLAVEEVKERHRSAACPIGSRRRLHLDHIRPGRRQ